MNGVLPNEAAVDTNSPCPDTQTVNNFVQHEADRSICGDFCGPSAGVYGGRLVELSWSDSNNGKANFVCGFQVVWGLEA